MALSFAARSRAVMPVGAGSAACPVRASAAVVIAKAVQIRRNEIMAVIRARLDGWSDGPCLQLAAWAIPAKHDSASAGNPAMPDTARSRHLRRQRWRRRWRGAARSNPAREDRA